MILPPLQGNLSTKDFFIYAACDEKYFDEFAIPLINSIKQNSSNDIHLHIFNPRQDQLDLCSKNSISYSYEYVSLEQFKSASIKLESTNSDEKQRTLTAMKKGSDASIQERMMKTYFACARFIRLNQLVSNQKFFAIDIDAIVRKTLPTLADNNLFIYRVSGNKARFLAGGIYTDNKMFLNEYAVELEKFLNQDHIYWGLDQDILENIVPKYQWSSLPYDLIDWEMKSSSYIWTAKGTRKNLSIFVNEKKKYSS